MVDVTSQHYLMHHYAALQDSRYGSQLAPDHLSYGLATFCLGSQKQMHRSLE